MITGSNNLQSCLPLDTCGFVSDSNILPSCDSADLVALSPNIAGNPVLPPPGPAIPIPVPPHPFIAAIPLPPSIVVPIGIMPPGPGEFTSPVGGPFETAEVATPRNIYSTNDAQNYHNTGGSMANGATGEIGVTVGSGLRSMIPLLLIFLLVLLLILKK